MAMNGNVARSRLLRPQLSINQMAGSLFHGQSGSLHFYYYSEKPALAVRLTHPKRKLMMPKPIEAIRAAPMVKFAFRRTDVE